jgi:glycerol uptake facilitator-like aquaporin
MRRAFLAALGTGSLAAATWTFAGAGGAAFFLTGVALGLTMVWLAHLCAYGMRAASMRPEVPLASRRRFAVSLIKAAGAMAAITALPGTAFAQSRLQNCIACCDKNLQGCGNGGDCNVNYQNCVNNCNAGGELPVTWRCW